MNKKSLINEFIVKSFPDIKIKFDNDERKILEEMHRENSFSMWITLTSGGIKKEGQEQENGFYIKKQEAWKAYKKILLDYLETQFMRNGVRIRWRMLPTAVSYDKGYKIVSRICVL